MKPFFLSALGSRASGPSSLIAGLFVVAFSWVLPWERSQAQLYIDVYQSRDNANQTLWVFSGSSTAAQLWSVRNNAAGNANFNRQDSWEVVENSGGLYIANAPSNQQLALTSIADQDAVTSRDRWYVANVLTNLTTDTAPTITFTTNSVDQSRGLWGLFLNEDTGSGSTDRDELGVRVSGGSFRYENAAGSAWSGAGLLAKPFSDFYAGDADGTFTFNNLGSATTGPRFAAESQGSVQVRFHRGTIIPEPEAYALVFGMFALGFVLFRHQRRRQMQKNNQQAPEIAAS